MLVNLIVIFPFVIALLILLLPQNFLKTSSVIASIIMLGITIYIYSVFKLNPLDSSLSFNTAWIKSLQINWNLCLDGISVLMVFLTALVATLIFASIRPSTAYNNSFYALAWTMIGAMLGAFTAKDGFVFYIFWEIALLPIYFICLMWGGENKSKITFKFFAYTLFGSLFMLASLLYLNVSGSGGWDIETLYTAGKNMSLIEQSFVFWGIFLAFAIKMPIFPFHTWQPDTYSVSPTQGTMLLSGVMLKMGTYGIARWLLPMVPLGVEENSFYAIGLSLFGVVYASVIAIVQKDIKRMMAWLSIAHVGLISAGLLVGNVQGLNGAFVQMLSHGINAVGCFFIVDIIYNRTKTHNMEELGGVRSVAPIFALFFIMILMASVALPFTNGFVGEFLLLHGVFLYQPYFAAFAGLSVILSATYMLRAYQMVMLGETNTVTATFQDLIPWEKTLLIVISILIIAFGLYPNAIIELIEPNVSSLVHSVSIKF